jgi:methylmalonyl-CoA mutase
MAKAIEAGIPKLRIEEAAAKTQARSRRRPADRSSASTSSSPRTKRRSTCSRIDNASVRAQQLDKLRRLKAERNEAETQAALTALTNGAQGDGNLLDLAVKAARAKATVGEISLAMEKVFGRHRAEIKAISGVYKREVGEMNPAVTRVQLMSARLSRRRMGAARASSSPRWARTGTIAARR